MSEEYVDCVKKLSKESFEKSELDLCKRNKSIEIALNYQTRALRQCSMVMYLQGSKMIGFNSSSFLTINKNIDYLYAAYILTRSGLYGASRPLFRNVYESLVILKTVALTNDQKLLDDFNEGKNLNITRKIFKNVIYPQSDEMKFFWNELCKYSHGSIYSSEQQISYDKNSVDIEYNYSMIEILLYLNFHVLNRYLFTDNMKKFSDRNLNFDNLCYPPLEREILREEMKTIKNESSRHARKLIADFSKVWKFKTL